MNVAVVLSALATLAWIAALVTIGLAIVRAARGQRLRAAGGIIIGAIILALALTTISAGLVFIQPTERGVVITAIGEGVRPEALQPGLNFVVPFLENVVKYSVARQTYTMSIASEEGQIRGDDSVEARTADGQIVKVDASVIFSIDPDRVVEQHIKWEGRYIDNLVRPTARGVIRDAVSQFGVEEVVSSKRFELLLAMEEDLNGIFEEGALVLHDFVLRNIAFSDEYAASVEQKQIAEQQAQQAAFVVEQREQEAEQARKVAQGKADAVVIEAKGQAEARLIQAEAEAKALELIAGALQDNPDLLTFEYIQKLSPGVQVMLVPSDNPYLLPLPELQGGATP
ncbi:MAG: SPFH domain-containing protein [Anaerolineales bacterium]|jgi:regulator of protease activity HflC (stomatin/prohibitin superfamily)